MHLKYSYISIMKLKRRNEHYIKAVYCLIIIYFFYFFIDHESKINYYTIIQLIKIIL